MQLQCFVFSLTVERCVRLTVIFFGGIELCRHVLSQSFEATFVSTFKCKVSVVVHVKI